MGYGSAAAVVNAWLGSAGHRANIEGNATRTGVSAVRSSDGVVVLHAGVLLTPALLTAERKPQTVRLT